MKITFALIAALLAITAQTAMAQPAARPADISRSVTLSLNEYNRLLDLANRPPESSAGAPVPSLLASADLKIRVERETVRGIFNLSGEVLRAGIARVNLISGATLVDANAGGRPLPLIAEGAVHAALIPGPNPFALTLEWGSAIGFAPGRALFSLPVPPAAAARATFDLPGEQADLHLSAGLITRRSVVSGRTIVEATLAPGTATEVWWSMRDSGAVAAQKESRLLADVLTLVTIGDSDVRMVALVDLTVVQGEPRSIEVRLPAQYEITSITGTSLERSEPRDATVLLEIADPAARRHQFLIGLERSHDGGSFVLDTGLVTLTGVQRERGEIAVEGVGTLELTAAEGDGVHRIDVRELSPALQKLSRQPILSAFRYQRATAAAPSLSLDVKRFADAGVLAAVADRAVATTLVTTEGRALTEVSLVVRNRAQPFLKVTLPDGASIVSVDVAGESAKPVLGADGSRVPLLRPAFRPQGPYSVSFVYVHAGTPFGRKGEINLTLPRLDMPVGVLEWEIFVPDNYSVRETGGNVLEARRFVTVDEAATGVAGGVVGGVAETVTVTAQAADTPAASPRAAPPSQNVINLQRRAAGVLPIRIDVPRAGTSHQYIKPLVVDQTPTINLKYRRR